MTAMKKFAATLLCLCLTTALLLSCTGCKAAGDAEKFVGEWEAKVDMTDMLNNMLASDSDTAELAEYIKVDSYTLTLEFTFTKDGKYTISIDRDALSDTTDALIDTLVAGTLKYFEDYIAEQAADYNVTVEDFLAASNAASVEDFLSQNGVDLTTMFDKNQLLTSFDQVESSGTYTAKDGVLMLKNADDSEEDMMEKYEFQSDTKVSLRDQTENELGDIVLVKK